MKLRTEKAVYGGSCLAHISGDEAALAGKAVFTPLTLPGELVEAHISEEKRGFVVAEADTVVEPSLLRTTPACPYFGACGGCSYQHAVYAHQVEMKTAILRETLERARIPEPPPIHTVSGHPWGYRNRVRLRIQPEPFRLCYRERRSHRLLPVAECPIAAPLVQKAIAVVTDMGAALQGAGLGRDVEFFADGRQGTLLISFFAESVSQEARTKLANICESLREELPQLAGAALFTARGKQPARLVADWGAPELVYDAAGFPYRVGRGSFFQVNRFLVDALVDLVAADRGGRTAWDLYAGVGLFARALTKRFERVIAVESSSASSADLRHNLEGTSHRAIEASALDFLQKQKLSGAKGSTPPELVVVDPPRAGLGSAIASLLGGIGPAQIVYVSCDPATLARDLAALVQFGYDLRTITMVDLFPQTFHLESVSVLERIS